MIRHYYSSKVCACNRNVVHRFKITSNKNTKSWDKLEIMIKDFLVRAEVCKPSMHKITLEQETAIDAMQRSKTETITMSNFNNC